MENGRSVASRYQSGGEARFQAGQRSFPSGQVVNRPGYENCTRIIGAIVRMRLAHRNSFFRATRQSRCWVSAVCVIRVEQRRLVFALFADAFKKSGEVASIITPHALQSSSQLFVWVRDDYGFYWFRIRIQHTHKVAGFNVRLQAVSRWLEIGVLSRALSTCPGGQFRAPFISAPDSRWLEGFFL